MWLARHTPDKTLPILHKVISAAKEEFADAVAAGDGIYAVGYCFGGKYVLALAGEGVEESATQPPKDEEEAGAAAEAVQKKPLIKAGAVAHGTDVTKEDIEGLKAPVSLACTENDQLFPDEVREAGRKFLEEKGIEHEIKVYSNVPHGFAVLGNYDDPAIHEAQTWAFEQMLDWLKSH
jgi:dienelactone hydrolase